MNINYPTVDPSALSMYSVKYRGGSLGGDCVRRSNPQGDVIVANHGANMYDILESYADSGPWLETRQEDVCSTNS
uniref:Uncharacterized protein n=1 Tax=Magallana gigas TaxID=29159 RepID=K1Q351_MAGGI